MSRPIVPEYLHQSKDRYELWSGFVRHHHVRRFCEIGVYRGHFSERIMSGCPQISEYVMIDPWRRLQNWNKPLNLSDEDFQAAFEEALKKTDFAKDKRVVLRGETIEAAQKIPEQSLDAVYIDGDHTLRGISIDLISMLPKIRHGGFICGDDATRNIWQHGASYTPSLVFPYILYFAEAHRVPLFMLPHNQFLIVNSPQKEFTVDDRYGYTSLDPVEIYKIQELNCPARQSRSPYSRKLLESVANFFRFPNDKDAR